MSTIAAQPLETPSKKVATGIAKMEMNSPSKQSASAGAAPSSDKFDDASFLGKGAANAKASLDKTPAAEKAVEIVVPTTHPLDTMGENRFVGEIDLEEEDEPLLVESSRRFVLFPIRYHEVSF